MNQSTLIKPAQLSGTALFTGTPCQCTIHPAEINHGIVFTLNNSRIPVNAQAITHAPAHPAFANTPPRCSAITNNNTTVWLVEHILSALTGLGITNATIELNHHELPIFDGSAQPFVDAILQVGIQSQECTLDPIKVAKPIRVENNDTWIEVTPSDQTLFEYTIDYGNNSPITQATVQWDGCRDQYKNLIAPARTFCLKHEAETMLNSGLFKHLNQGDMLVFDDSGPIDKALHHPHECAYHKLLDLIGDLALIGRPIQAHIRAHKSGHVLAHKLAKAIADSE